MNETYAIIGAGIAGASVAYHLGRRTDADVHVFERGTTGDETTARSIAQFGYYGDSTQHRMKRYGMQLYNEFFADPRADLRYEYTGLLSVATSETGARELHRATVKGDAALGKTTGTGWDRDPVRVFEPDELREQLLIPSLDTNAITGALFRPRMGYMATPAALAEEFVARAMEEGVVFHFETAVEEIVTKGDRVTAVRADGEYPVSAVVCASGPWNVQLARSVGVELPVRHTIAPVIRLDPAIEIRYNIPTIVEMEGPHAIHRRQPDEWLVGYNPVEGYDLQQRFDPDELGDSVPEGIKQGMRDVTSRLTPAIADAPIVDEWVGVRSQTPDDNPIVGWTELSGFSIAAFHTSGIQLAPAVGRMIADQLIDGEPGSQYDSLSITRFEGYEDCQ